MYSDRRNRPVQIIRSQGGGLYPFAGVRMSEVNSRLLGYTEQGRYAIDEDHDNDLICALPDETEVCAQVHVDLTEERAPGGYDALLKVLGDAYNQAASGKGKARHNARNVSFERQPILEIARMCGLGYPTGQAQKKTQEAVSMFNRGEADRAEAELLGAINYLAAAILLIRETKSGA
jgi:hypothetical protein